MDCADPEIGEHVGAMVITPIGGVIDDRGTIPIYDVAKAAMIWRRTRR